MTKEFAPRRLDVKTFAEESGRLSGETAVQQHERLMAETQGRGGQSPVAWSATGEVRNSGHLNPDIWIHLKANTVLSLTCQRCLVPVDVPVTVDRSFRFVPDEEMAAAQDDESEEDVLALSRSFDLIELVEDELLMELPLAPTHPTCPQPLRTSSADVDFESATAERQNPFALLGKLKLGDPPGK